MYWKLPSVFYLVKLSFASSLVTESTGLCFKR